MIRPILRAAAPVFAQRFTKDCCLNATRVLIEVFRDFGIPARAMVVRCVAGNAEYFASLAQEKELEGAWACACDAPSGFDGKHWDGHVVVFVRGMLVDAASGNMSRPAKRIHVPDVYAGTVPRGWERGGVQHVVELPEDGALAYEALPKNRDHEKLPGFQRSPHNLEIAQTIKARCAVMA